MLLVATLLFALGSWALIMRELLTRWTKQRIPGLWYLPLATVIGLWLLCMLRLLESHSLTAPLLGAPVVSLAAFGLGSACVQQARAERAERTA